MDDKEDTKGGAEPHSEMSRRRFSDAAPLNGLLGDHCWLSDGRYEPLFFLLLYGTVLLMGELFLDA